MDICLNCGALLSENAVLIDDRIPPMTNGDKIIAPRCGSCAARIPPYPAWHSGATEQCVVLITGLCGSGKSSIGQKIAEETGYVHIDGDAVSKRVNWDIRNGLLANRSGYLVYDELLETIQVVLQLGFSAIATYVFSNEVLERFEAKFSEWGIKCCVVALKTEPTVCIQRDRLRSCWSAGEDFIMRWLDEQRTVANSGHWVVVDNSFIDLDETCRKILKYLRTD